MATGARHEPDPRELRAACAAVRAGCACSGLRRAAREMTQRYERALAPSGVRATQFPILVALGEREEIPIVPLAEGLGLERTTLTRNLRILEGRGLVTVAAAEHDARMRLASITPEGRRVLGHALELWRAEQHDVVEAFGRERLRELFGDLADLTAAGAG
jgi:DNA-binding MarR family transcriptional regulator